MKIYNIFVKNLKVVARNWIYFIVLFIFPFFLILTSAILLNSSDLKNIGIGVVDEYNGYPLGIGEFSKIRDYEEIDECVYYLTNNKISVCIHIKKIDDNAHIDVYIDNTRRIIELYTRQIILEKVFREQSRYLETTSDFIDSRLSIYSTSLKEASSEMSNVENDLLQQENLMRDYRYNLSLVRQDFDQSYYQIKNLQPRIQTLRNEIYNSDLDQNINNVKNNLDSIESDLLTIKNYLNGRLGANDYNYISSLIDSSLQSVQNSENSLSNVQNNYSKEELISILDSIDELISKLDMIKESLDKADQDLTNSIQKLSESRNRISIFKAKLSDMENEISYFQSNTNNGSVSLNFIKAFPITGDLVLIAFPFVISIIITFSSLVLSNRFILNQVNKPSYQREILAPTRDLTYVFSDYLINLFFVSIQALVLLIIGFFWFDIALSKLPTFMLAIFLASSSLIFIGVGIGYLIKSESLSTLFTIFLGMFLFVFSDMLVPSVLTTPIIKFLINLSPFVILNNILSESIIVGKTAEQLALPISRLCILVISSFLIAYFSKKASKENVIQ